MLLKLSQLNFVFILSVLLGSYSDSSESICLSKLDKIQEDTIAGYFLYEVNVPLKCYTRFDQIERGHNLIIYDSLIGEKNIQYLYRNGIYILDYESLIVQYITRQGKGIPQNQDALWSFRKAIYHSFNETDTADTQNLHFDKSKTLSYKKIYAKFVVLRLGKLEQMIPDTNNYQCCYANRKEVINSFFITDILEFDLF